MDIKDCADRHWMNCSARNPTSTVSESWSARFGVEHHSDHRIDQRDSLSARFVHSLSNCDHSIGIRTEFGP
jgi:hypothetical protein